MEGAYYFHQPQFISRQVLHLLSSVFQVPFARAVSIYLVLRPMEERRKRQAKQAPQVVIEKTDKLSYLKGLDYFQSHFFASVDSI